MRSIMQETSSIHERDAARSRSSLQRDGWVFERCGHGYVAVGAKRRMARAFIDIAASRFLFGRASNWAPACLRHEMIMEHKCSSHTRLRRLHVVGMP
jgi:hypothetical protein